jgi:multiple sugar transport system permease protein
MTAPAVQRTKRRSRLVRRLRKAGSITVFTVVTAALCCFFILPLLYAVSQSLGSGSSIGVPGAPLWPSVQRTYECTDSKACTYQSQYVDSNTGQLVNYGDPVDVSQRKFRTLLVYRVPSHGELALLDDEDSSTGGATIFIDPNTNTQVKVVVEASALEIAWVPSVTIDNYSTALQWANDISDSAPGGFARWLLNSTIIAGFGAIGAVISGILVAYGFARFRFPGRNVLFFVLIGSVLIPYQVTLIPQFILYRALGLTGSFLPLIVPNYFGSAFYVFLLRQYFLTLPRQLDEAAMVDGASPFRILISIIIPQSWPAIIAVGLFQFFFSWNDFMGPLIYLSGRADLYPVALGLNFFMFKLASGATNAPIVMEAGSLIAMLVPVAIFVAAQKVFMRGVVISGVEK